MRQRATNHLSDDELVRQAKAGDLTAFDALVARHYEQVFALAFHLLGNADDAADATQEAFLKAFERLSQFRGDAAFSTWLYRITVNVCHDWHRRRQPVPFSQLSDEEGEAVSWAEATEPDPEEEWQRRERRRLSKKFCSNCPTIFGKSSSSAICKGSLTLRLPKCWACPKGRSNLACIGRGMPSKTFGNDGIGNEWLRPSVLKVAINDDLPTSPFATERILQR